MGLEIGAPSSGRELRLWSLWMAAQGLLREEHALMWFRVQGLGFRVPGSGFRVQGLRFRVAMDPRQHQSRKSIEPVWHEAL